MEFSWAFNHHFELIWVLIGAVILNLILVCLPLPKRPKKVQFHNLLIFAFFAVVLGFSIYWKIILTLFPFRTGKQKRFILEREVTVYDDYHRDNLTEFLAHGVQARRAVNVSKPNLLIIEIESLEYGLLGPMALKYKKMMPFISSLVMNGTYFRNVVSQPYTTWSVASMFTVQCNMPLLLHHVTAGNQGQFHLVPNHKCVGDFLHESGYKLYSYQTNIFVGSFKKHLAMHHWNAYDAEDHKLKKDWDVFGFVGDEVLRKLESEVNPWVLHLANADCHAVPRYFADRRCAKRMAASPLLVRSFDCVDQIIEAFLEKFERSPLFNTTEVILYGDHVIMEGNHRRVELAKPRSLVLSFPYRPKKTVYKNVTLYDIAPTIMDILGIDYSPKFPFGTNLFSNKTGHPPDVDDFQVIYDAFTKEMKWDDNITCWNGTKGFCTYAKS